ncbi:hypothetical protein [Methylobacterium nodulans]|uniref:Knr4/Smi1-like domain-containing protein n=1 Tax=Methylobacterium nodulans (strain LMG 21967 / CNCM I-2342 / ORS 2060) TaxID=460265 RepID=B8IVJ6_METNO|nr:hypothetical protein [Methylobacterium nodulans]ACL62436.1 hypothetical protein Mnod_8290 [Methylobacterium nodulans ORS 2060]
MASSIEFLLKQLWVLNEQDGIQQSMRRCSHTMDGIATFDPSKKIKLSPMLRERFRCAYEWENAAIGQTWLGLDKVAIASDDTQIRKHYDLRVQNWTHAPPAMTTPSRTAIYGINTERREATYLAWPAEDEEPIICALYGGQFDIFKNLKRYLEFLAGDRCHDDSEEILPHVPLSVDEVVTKAREDGGLER